MKVKTPAEIKAVDFPVDKITCQGCVNFIEKTISDIDGVAAVHANLAESSVNVQYETGRTDLNSIRKRLDDINYNVKTSRANIQIEGMHCASCVSKIEHEVSRMEGVLDIHVNLADQTARVEYMGQVIDTGQILKRIESLGYTASQQEDEIEKEDLKKDYHSRLLRNFKIALPFTALIFFFSHLGMFGIKPLGEQTTFVILFFLALPVQFYCGRRFYVGFWKSLENFTASMDTLVAVGTSAAFLYSVIATFYPSLLSSVDQNVAVYYDTAAIIITLILFGRLLESRAKNVTSAEIEKLIKLEGRTAVVERDGKERQVDRADVEQSDIVVIKPGSKLPVDGVVLEGFSSVDESMLTGEPLPREVKPGDRVYAGSINKSGRFKFEALAVGNDTVLSKIVESVKQIISSRAPIQRLADRVAAVFVPVVMSIAALAFVLWMILPAATNLTFALMIFIAVLIIACPCALGLATPTAIMVGSSRGAREGILIKSAEVLERVQKINMVVFDKTGTLSEGRPHVDEFRNLGNFDPRKLLSIASALERASEHPLSEAVIVYATEKGVEELEVRDFEAVPGRGLRGKIDGSQVHLGNLAFMKDEGVSLNNGSEQSGGLRSNGKTVLLLAVDFSLEGLIYVSDLIKPEAEAVVEELKQSGRSVWLLSGDNKSAAESVASQLGIENVLAEVLPHEKSDHIKSLKAAGNKVAMVGDGVNDAPALAEADIGIALGSGTDVALAFSDITLIGENLHGVTKALKLSETTLKTIKQNLVWAFGYNVIAIPLAAGLFYPIAGILLSPVVASAAMAFSSVFVISNSLRLRKLRL
jgi:Cu+-exporting ATPase